MHHPRTARPCQPGHARHSRTRRPGMLRQDHDCPGPDWQPAPALALIKSCIFMAVRGDLEYNAWSFCPQPGSGHNSQAAMDSADSCVQCDHQRPSRRCSRRRSGPWTLAAYRFRSLKLSTLRCPACPEHNGTVPAVYRKCPEAVTVNSCGRKLQAYVFSL